MWELDRKVSDWFELATEDDPRSVIFSADGRQMVVIFPALGTSRPSPDIGLYDLSTGEELFGVEVHGNYISKAALSADGKTLAALTQNKVLVWNLADPQEEPIEISASEDWDFDRAQLALSTHGDLAAAYTPHSISIWDVSTGELLAEIEIAQKYPQLYDLEFSPDGRYLASVAGDGIVRLWGIPSN
jgi:WD40 repeat protein